MSFHIVQIEKKSLIKAGACVDFELRFQWFIKTPKGI